MSENEANFDYWAILELMGHVRIAGRVTEEERFGTKMGRIDIPGSSGAFTTQYFAGGAVYRLTPTTEDIARAVAARSQPQPVQRWELPPAPREVEELESESDGDDDEWTSPMDDPDAA